MGADQMAFEEVTEMEHIAGDPEFTDWLAQGKPTLEPAGQAAQESLPSEACSL